MASRTFGSLLSRALVRLVLGAILIGALVVGGTLLRVWQVARTDVTLTLKNPRLTKATLLDAAGYAKSAVRGTRAANGAFTVTLPPDTLYLVLEGAAAPAGNAKPEVRR